MLNTIGPVWDGNEVWLITAGGAMFAAFPGMYATVFSGLYLPLLAILVAMILRVCAIEWRGKIDDPRVAVVGRRRHRGRARGCPPSCGAWRSPHWCAGCPSTPTSRCSCPSAICSTPYTLLGGLAMAGLFLFHGAVFVALKTEGAVRDDAVRFAARLALPVTALVAAFGLWTQVAHGNDWTWMVLAVAVIAQLSAVMLVWSRGGDGWAFVEHMTVVAAVVVLLFGSLYPNLVPSTLNPDWSLTIYNASSTAVHAEDHDLGGADLRPAGDRSTRAGRTGCSGNESRPTGSRRRSGCRRQST